MMIGSLELLFAFREDEIVSERDFDAVSTRLSFLSKCFDVLGRLGLSLSLSLSRLFSVSAFCFRCLLGFSDLLSSSLSSLSRQFLNAATCSGVILFEYLCGRRSHRSLGDALVDIPAAFSNL